MNILEEKKLPLSRRDDGRLILEKGDDKIPVKAYEAFPWKHPGAYISLRDEKGKEHLFVEDYSKVDAESRKLLKQELSLRTYIPRISRILEIEEILEDWHWTVECENGNRRFLVNRHDEPRVLEDSRIVLKDRYGDLYVVDPSKLDKASYKKLAKNVDF